MTTAPAGPPAVSAKTTEPKAIQVKTEVPPPALPAAASPIRVQAGSATPFAGTKPLPIPSPMQQSTGTQPRQSIAVGSTPLETAPSKPAETSSAPSQTASPQSGRYVTIDFDNVDISVFIKFVSELTGKNFVIDDKVKGKVTIISPKKIPVDEVYKVFESVLEIYGFAAVEAGDVIKVILAQEARGKNLELRLKREDIASEDKIVTQIFSLQHATPDDMKKVLDPLISKTSVILAYPPTGMLIITDVLSNIKRLQDIVTALDVEGVGELISYVPLKYASATEMVKSLAMIFQQQAVPGRGIVSPIKIVADDRTNALIILAAENDMARIRELLNLMDKEIPRGAGTIRVYYLQNAKAEDLAKILTSIPQQAKTATGTTTAAPSTSTAAFSKNVQIMADKATNSLIITADTADYLVIEDVIRKLDITRAMVYLEALIMEVNAEKSFNVGVEWSMLKNVNVQSVTDLGGQSVGLAGFTGSGNIPQLNSAGTGISMPSGFSLGVIGAGITIGGLLFPNIGAVLNAYQNDTDVRILSTPQLLTLDNEDAEITVGENVPYVSRQDSGAMGVVGTSNYSSYEYKDVGVTLKVTPQINKDGFIRMKLDQTVTKIVNQSATVDAAGSKVLTPTTLKRTAKTTVVVKSGETVVIGGMIQDDSSTGTGKVPLLGDIPLLGWLFKTRSALYKRTNLFVFITPRIIEQPEDARKIKEEKMDYMRTIREGTIRTAPQKKTEAKEKE
ncbi:MAG: type II secretion system secretin GspD [Deltaproteobacteria bacterium]|nr:type II secretion system secretin GspD [Deltaproteobacteria bacterium]